MYVPAGEFQMGGESGGDDDEMPKRQVYLDAFWMDRTEVTNAMFARFVTAKSYTTDAEKEGAGLVYSGSDWREVSGADWRHPAGPTTNINALDDYPVVQVSWNDAQAYCQWAGATLPTEAQWEKAARGTDGRVYPWGNQAATCEYAVIDDGSGNGCGKGNAPWAVGIKSKGAGPYGTLDMAGNVWEWVADWYDSKYYASSPASNPTGPSSGQYRVMRGGAWDNSGPEVRVTHRLSSDPEFRSGYLGFRCVGGLGK